MTEDMILVIPQTFFIELVNVPAAVAFESITTPEAGL
jgi:hypothetical protein